MRHRRKSSSVKTLLSCGGFSCMGRRIITEDLMLLQALVRLRDIGLSFSGGSVFICRAEYEELTAEKIKSAAGRKDGLIILTDTEGKEKKQKGRFGRTRMVRQRKLVTAVSSDELFFLIDAKPDSFEILSLADSASEIEKIRKENGQPVAKGKAGNTGPVERTKT